MNDLVQLILAAGIASVLNALGEIANMIAKLRRLQRASKGEPMHAYRWNVDSRLKAYGIGIGGLVAATAIIYVVLDFIGLKPMIMAWVALGCIVLVNLTYLIGIDRFHTRIEPFIEAEQSKHSDQK